MSPSRSKASAWLLPACLGLNSRGTPFHLVQLGGDPLGLIADCDERPALRSPEGEELPGPPDFAKTPYPILSRLGLAPAWQEPGGLFAELKRSPGGPRLKACPWTAAAAEAAAVPPAPFEGLLVFSWDAPEPPGMRELLAPWEDRGFWVILEGETLSVARVIEGKLARVELARASEQLVVLKGWNFLQPLAPVQRPRLTTEEPPKFTRG